MINKYKKIENADLLEYARIKLPNEGVLKQNNTTHYCYLKVHNDFIFQLISLIQESNLVMPNYFPPKCDSGAHISVIYPNEMLEKINVDETEQPFSFEVADFFSLSALNKTFFALTIASPSLEQLRLKYGLPIELNYQGLLVPFHITIAVSLLPIHSMADSTTY